MAAADFIQSTMSAIGAKLLVRGWLSSNNIVFAGPDQPATVVDTGYASHAEQTLSLLRQTLAGGRLHHIVNTHLHSDHCGGNAALQHAWPDLDTWVPQGYATSVMPWDESRLSYQQCDQRCDPFKVTHLLRDGAEIQLGQRQWQVHGAGGHDPDAVILFEPQSRTLISGDVLWQDRLAIIFPELTGQPGFEAADTALDTIEKLSPRLILPGHGDAFTDLHAALKASRSRLQAFAAAPENHRQHAVRALLTYHMLEYRSRSRKDLLQWMLRTPIIQLTLRYEADPANALRQAQEAIQRLCKNGVLIDDSGQINLVTDQQ